MQPLLTIAIPTFNGSKTIGNMLDLLLPQVDNRTEIFVMDNASIDNTHTIIDAYRLKYPFLQYCVHDRNIGADANFLACMRMATGRYVYLLSDDDVLVEGALSRILTFLESSPEMGLIYLGTANFYGKYAGKENCVCPIPLPVDNICTTDKGVFFQHAKHYWGFLSSFIINKARFDRIGESEQYYGTYWLQSYIHILCASGRDTSLGVVSGLCVGAGVYVTRNNFDVATVDGINYRKMLDAAVAHGFDAKQLDEWYIDRLCLLASHGIVKEKATGNYSTNRKLLYRITRKYWKAWVKIYPVIFAPGWLCRWYMNRYRNKLNINMEETVNRAGDVPSVK